jgi:hypothetical protein
MTNPLDHYINCERCGKPITVSFRPADDGDAYREAEEQEWPCPHGCGLKERPSLKGRILNVWRGHSPGSAFWIERMKTAATTSGGKTITGSNTEHLIAPMIEAHDRGDLQGTRTEAMRLLHRTEEFIERREDALETLWDLRLGTPLAPSRGLVAGLTDAQQARYDAALERGDYDQAESILDLSPLAQLRVYAKRLIVAVDASK